MENETATALKLWVVMNRAQRSLEAHLDRQVQAHGLNLSEFGVLEVLLSKGPLPIGEVGDRILLTSGSMTYVIDKLARRGLLNRRPCASDRRVIYAELTPEGKTLIEVVFKEHAALIRDLMKGLKPEEQEQAIELMKRLGRYAQDEYAGQEVRAESA